MTASTARSMPLLCWDSYPYSTISEFSYRKFVNLSRMRVHTHHSSAYVPTRGDALCYCSSAHCGVMTHRGPHNVLIMHPPLIYRLVTLIQVQADLMCLDFCRPAQPLHLKPPELSTVATPLKVQAWQKALSGHPDQALARYICDGDSGSDSNGARP